MADWWRCVHRPKLKGCGRAYALNGQDYGEKSSLHGDFEQVF